MRLIWHLVRYHIGGVKMRAKRMGVQISKWKGYTLCDNLTPYVARHILEHKPEWEGLFVLKEVPTDEKKEEV